LEGSRHAEPTLRAGVEVRAEFVTRDRELDDGERLGAVPAEGLAAIRLRQRAASEDHLRVRVIERHEQVAKTVPAQDSAWPAGARRKGERQRRAPGLEHGGAAGPKAIEGDQGNPA